MMIADRLEVDPARLPTGTAAVDAANGIAELQRVAQVIHSKAPALRTRASTAAAFRGRRRRPIGSSVLVVCLFACAEAH
jgi:hypothetical protein